MAYSFTLPFQAPGVAQEEAGEGGAPRKHADMALRPVEQRAAASVDTSGSAVPSTRGHAEVQSPAWACQWWQQAPGWPGRALIRCLA